MTAAADTAKANGKPTAAPVDEFPLETFRDAARHLRRPFTPAAVKFKPQSVLGDDGKGVLCVAYIDARLVIERLNLLVPHLWHDEYRAVGQGQMWCDLTVDGITRSDVGEGTGKALVSDALKRAAVHFGIGVSLYAIPQQRIWKDTQNGKLVSIWPAGQKQNGKPKYDARLEDAGQAHLRNVYAHWLDAHGIKAFGEPLDHGDADDAQGDHEADPPADVAPGVDPATGEVDPAEVEFRESLVANAQRLVEGKVWTGKDLKAQLVGAGAKDTSTVPAAIASLSRDQARALGIHMEGLLTPADAKAAA